jgi:hypothetical protein
MNPIFEYAFALQANNEISTVYVGNNLFFCNFQCQLVAFPPAKKPAHTPERSDGMSCSNYSHRQPDLAYVGV